MAIAWLLTMSSLLLIPSVMIYKLMNTNGTILEVNKVLLDYLKAKERPLLRCIAFAKTSKSKGNQAFWLVMKTTVNLSEGSPLITGAVFKNTECFLLASTDLKKDWIELLLFHF